MHTKRRIKQVISKIKDSVDPDKIYLFGSFASGKANKNSDLDICIIKNNFASKNEQLLKAKKALFNLQIPIDMLFFKEKDFLKRQNIWGSIQYEVFHKGIKMYEKRK